MPQPHPSPVRTRLYEVIFETRTPAGRVFDLVLLAAILASVVVLVKTVPTVGHEVTGALGIAEWGFTILFTLEYLVRLGVVAHPRRYATSFFGVVDLVASFNAAEADAALHWRRKGARHALVSDQLAGEELVTRTVALLEGETTAEGLREALLETLEPAGSGAPGP